MTSGTRHLVLAAALGLLGACSTGTLGDGAPGPIALPGDGGGDASPVPAAAASPAGPETLPGPGPASGTDGGPFQPDSTIDGSTGTVPTGPLGDGVDADAGGSQDTVAPAPDTGGPDELDTGCPAGMVTFDGFCMDRYEAPNEAGAPPIAMSNALDGEAWCAERGKRLCSEAEWVRACQGPSERAYPYGQSYQRGTCNDDKVWRSPGWSTLATWPSAAAMAEAERLYQADPSGSRQGCVSEEGVQDLTGNVAEWVRRSFNNSNNYDHVLKGCYWAGCYGGAPPSCGFVNPAHPSGFRTYEAGFRCCLDSPTP